MEIFNARNIAKVPFRVNGSSERVGRDNGVCEGE